MVVVLIMVVDFMIFIFVKYLFGNFKFVFFDDMVEDMVLFYFMVFVSN